MNKLNKIYKAILESLGCTIKDDHSIVMCNKGEEYPVKVDGKQVYLPVTAALNEVTIGRAFFHPACESITSKETEMDKVLRKLITSTLYFSFRPIADVLMRVAQKKTTKTLPSVLVEQLDPIAKVTKETMGEVIDLIKRIAFTTEFEGVDTRIIALTVTRGGKTENDERVYYRCTPSFPYYKELTRVLNQNSRLADDPKALVIFGEHKYSYQALFLVQRIFDIAIPCVNDPSRAEAVSTTQTAARMCAMLRCFGYIVNEINTIVGKFRKEFDAVGMYGIDVSWIEDLDNLPELVGLVPPMEYNNYNTVARKQETGLENMYDPFGISGINSVDNTINRQMTAATQVPGQQPAAQPQPTQADIEGAPAPKPKPGESYIGMTVLQNGLFEYRYQSGNIIRVTCVNENGKEFQENFFNVNQPPQQQPVYQQPLYPQQPYQQPIYPNQVEDQWTAQGWVRGNGYIQQPNGVVVPIISPNHPTYQQPQQPAYYQMNTGWNMDPNYNQFADQSQQQPQTIMPSGAVNNNWSS